MADVRNRGPCVDPWVPSTGSPAGCVGDPMRERRWGPDQHSAALSSEARPDLLMRPTHGPTPKGNVVGPWVESLSACTPFPAGTSPSLLLGESPSGAGGLGSTPNRETRNDTRTNGPWDWSVGGPKDRERHVEKDTCSFLHVVFLAGLQPGRRTEKGYRS